jgi:hypothetical protein
MFFADPDHFQVPDNGVLRFLEPCRIPQWTRRKAETFQRGEKTSRQITQTILASKEVAIGKTSEKPVAGVMNGKNC